MSPVYPVQLVLPEGASDRVEELLRSQTCPIHIHTTVGSDGLCQMCAIESRPKPRRVSDNRRSTRMQF